MKFPFAPLEPLIDAKWQPANDRETCSGYTAKTASMFNVHTAMAARWRREGLSEDAADRVACSLGYHPGLIWPEWFNIPIPEDDLFAGGCGRGTHYAIKRHRQRGETPCGACAAFQAAYEADWRRRNPDLERARVARNNQKRRAAA